MFIINTNIHGKGNGNTMDIAHGMDKNQNDIIEPRFPAKI
jgi:hypothetical protein